VSGFRCTATFRFRLFGAGTLLLACLFGAAARPGAALTGQIDVPSVAAPLPLQPSADPAGWSATTNLTLGWDLAHQKGVSEATTVHIASDGKSMFVRFDATQREPIAASQRSDDVSLAGDDEVWIDLWPNGSSGFFYQFVATPIGTHYESSSENTGFAPRWQSAGSVHDGGYTVTMKIPIDVLRGAKAGSGWRAQFVRLVHASGEEQVWTYGAAQTQPDDLKFAGAMNVAEAVSHPAPRLALYSLGAVAAPSAGGSTSRAGADLSVPITPTAAFFATVHPDFSNVELDQQSISPSAFQRYYSEVRPFFTQGANFFNQLNCDVCSLVTEFYTPAIPAPREGYALEGQQGQLGFAAVDAVGDARDDQASVLDYTSPDLKWNATVQRVAVTTPDLIDDVTTTGVSYSDHKHVSWYFDYGSDSGSNVLEGDDAQRYDFGGGWGSPTFAIFGSTRKIGDYYDPVDGFVQHPGIAGYALYTNKMWLFNANDVLSSLSLGAILDRYQGQTQGFNQTDNALVLDTLTRSLIDFQVTVGSDYLRLSDGIMAPVSQNGFGITYHSGSQNSVNNFGQHGSSATPTSIVFNTGRYGDGRLDSWLRSSTVRAGVRGTVTLEVDDTAQWMPKAPNNIQWFERLSYAYQIDRDSSLALGIRRVDGDPPIPNGGGDCIGKCTNLSFSYHLRRRHAELYLGYGDPNTLTTTPQAILKLIYYVGAEKGT